VKNAKILLRNITENSLPNDTSPNHYTFELLTKFPRIVEVAIPQRAKSIVHMDTNKKNKIDHKSYGSAANTKDAYIKISYFLHFFAGELYMFY
jgi:hypothetical protein